jgi:hypothetical protein
MLDAESCEPRYNTFICASTGSIKSFFFARGSAGIDAHDRGTAISRAVRTLEYETARQATCGLIPANAGAILRTRDEFETDLLD